MEEIGIKPKSTQPKYTETLS